MALDEEAAISAEIGMRPDGQLSCVFAGQLSRERLEAERSYALRP